METKIALLLSLPTSMGGYGIPQPDLNAQVTHSFSGARHPERFRCDLYWPTVKLALEYDSHQYHASSEKVVLDSTRRMKIESKKNTCSFCHQATNLQPIRIRETCWCYRPIS